MLSDLRPVDWMTVVMFGWFLFERIRKAVTRRGVIAQLRQAAASHPDYKTGVLLALGCAVLWSGGYVSLSFVSATVGPFTLTALMLGVAATTLYLARRFRNPPWSKGVRPFMKPSIWDSRRGLLATIANGGNFLFSVVALYYMSAARAMSLINCYPLLLLLILVCCGRRSPSGSVISAAMVATAGMLMLAENEGAWFQSGGDAIGFAIALLAALSMAAYTVAMESVEEYIFDTHARLVYMTRMFFALFAVFLVIAFFAEEHSPMGLPTLAIVGANGLRVAAVYFMFCIAIDKAGPLIASCVAVLQVPLTLLFDSVFMATGPTRALGWGTTLILAGTAVLLAEELSRARASEVS